MPRKYWTPKRLEKLRSLRLTHGCGWEAIGVAFDKPAMDCERAFQYHGFKSSAEAARELNAAMPAIDHPDPVEIKMRVQERVPSDQAISSPAALPPSGRARRLEGVALDIIARVAKQGPTAGVFGDPPAGRSALEKKRAEEGL